MSDYITVPDLKERMGNVAHANNDSVMQSAITAASRAIDIACQRRFYADTTNSTRIYKAERHDRLDVHDFWTNAGLVVTTDPSDNGGWSQTWGTNDYELAPYNGVRAGLEGWPYFKILAVGRYHFPTCTRRATVRVTARWGWSTPPAGVIEACSILAAHLTDRANSVNGLITGDFDPVRISRNMDPDAMAALSPFMHLVET